MFKAKKHKSLQLFFITLILCFSGTLSSFTTFAEETGTETPQPPACIEIGKVDLRNQEYATTYTSCAAFSYRQPYEVLAGESAPKTEISEYNKLTSNDNLWAEANDTDRRNYCQVIDCLSLRMRNSNAARITPIECNIQNYNSGHFQDSRCMPSSGLVCETDEKGQPTKFYATAEIARIEQLGGGGEKNCEINTPKEKCLQSLPAKVEECRECLDALERYRSNPNGAEPDGSCSQYNGVSSCSNFYSCESGSTPTARTFQRTPFGTEFFDVTSDEKGLGANTEGNFTVNAEGGGIVGTINTIANFLVRMISVLSLVVFIIGAFILIIANGEENQINRGKDAIKLSLLGIVIVMLSYTIVVLVQSIFF